MIIKDGEARGRDTYAKALVAVQMEGEGQRWTSLGGMRATHDVSVLVFTTRPAFLFFSLTSIPSLNSQNSAEWTTFYFRA